MKSLYILVVSILLISACEKLDSTAPTLTISKPAYGAYYNLGDTLIIEGKFEDNESLSSYTLTIGNKDKDTITGFVITESNSISGTDYEYNSEIIIPSSIADTLFYLHYHLRDASNNSRNYSHLINLN